MISSTKQKALRIGDGPIYGGIIHSNSQSLSNQSKGLFAEVVGPQLGKAFMPAAKLSAAVFVAGLVGAGFYAIKAIKSAIGWLCKLGLVFITSGIIIMLLGAPEPPNFGASCSFSSSEQAASPGVLPKIQSAYTCLEVLAGGALRQFSFFEEWAYNFSITSFFRREELLKMSSPISKSDINGAAESVSSFFRGFGIKSPI